MERLFIFQLRTMFLEQDAYLSQFTVRPFNYVCEMIRLQGHQRHILHSTPPLPPFYKEMQGCVKIAILSYLMLSMK